MRESLVCGKSSSVQTSSSQLAKIQSKGHVFRPMLRTISVWINSVGAAKTRALRDTWATKIWGHKIITFDDLSFCTKHRHPIWVKPNFKGSNAKFKDETLAAVVHHVIDDRILVANPAASIHSNHAPLASPSNSIAHLIKGGRFLILARRSDMASIDSSTDSYIHISTQDPSTARWKRV